MSSEFSFRPTGSQTADQHAVDSFVREARNRPNTKNPIVLGINLQAMMRVKNNHYPKDMYHATLAMRQAFKEEEEVALAEMGYSTKHIPQDYPKWLHRRNMAEKFAEQQENGTLTILNNAFIESRLVKTAEDEQKLMRLRPPAGCEQWVEKIEDIAALPETEYVDPQTEISRLRGQLEQANRQLDAGETKRGPGRPRKEEQIEA